MEIHLLLINFVVTKKMIFFSVFNAGSVQRQGSYFLPFLFLCNSGINLETLHMKIVHTYTVKARLSNARGN